MKTTKQQLRQIIKEELEVILTNEEAGELFGEGVEAELEEQELNEADMSDIQIIINAFAKIGLNLSTAIVMGLIAYAVEQAMGRKKAKPEDEQMMEQEKVATDVARVGKKLGGVQGLEPLLKSINTRAEFEALMMQFVQLVAKDKLNPNDVKMGIRNVAAAILKGK